MISSKNLSKEDSYLYPDKNYHRKDWRFFTVYKDDCPIGYIGNIYTDKRGFNKYFTIEKIGEIEDSKYLYPMDYISSISHGNVYLAAEFSEIENSYFYDFENVFNREAYDLFQSDMAA